MTTHNVTITKVDGEHPVALDIRPGTGGSQSVTGRIYLNSRRHVSVDFSVSVIDGKPEPLIGFTGVNLSNNEAEQYLSAGAIAQRLSRYYTVLLDDALSGCAQDWADTLIGFEDTTALTELLLLGGSEFSEKDAKNVLVQILKSGIYGNLYEGLDDLDAKILAGLVTLCGCISGFSEMEKKAKNSRASDVLFDFLRPYWSAGA